MGTRFDMVLTQVKEEQAKEASQLIKTWITETEKKISCHDPESQVFLINSSAHISPFAMDEQLWNIFRSAAVYHERTAGLFDISLKPLKDFRAENREVIPGSISALTGWDKIVLDPLNMTIYFRQKGCAVDFGGFGKGFALDRVRDLLRQMKVNNAFISFGESAVLALGHHPHGDCWKTGVKHLLSPGKSIENFKISDQALSTSASYTGTDSGGKRVHIFHPRTGKPVVRNASVSVVASSALDAEVLSTALLLADKGDIKLMKPNFPGVRGIIIDYSDADSRVERFAWE